jgi:hypothetical protein
MILENAVKSYACGKIIDCAVMKHESTETKQLNFLPILLCFIVLVIKIIVVVIIIAFIIITTTTTITIIITTTIIFTLAG